MLKHYKDVERLKSLLEDIEREVEWLKEQKQEEPQEVVSPKKGPLSKLRRPKLRGRYDTLSEQVHQAKYQVDTLFESLHEERAQICEALGINELQTSRLHDD